MPLESIATQVFQAIYQRQQAEISWIALLWTVAKLNKYWIGYDAHHCHQSSKSIVEVSGAGRWRVISHRIFTAHALQSVIAKSMGHRSPQRT